MQSEHGQYSESFSTGLGFYVYRLWAANGTCLYVGCAGERAPRRVGSRLSEHKRSKSWWPQVTRIDVASFASSAEIIVEERRQVQALNPVHNKKLRRYCRQGHDLTLPDARNDEGGCRECHRVWGRKREPARRNRENVSRYRRTPAGKVHLAAYERSRRTRKTLQQWARSRRPAPGQDALW
jgi:hypothetical protein